MVSTANKCNGNTQTTPASFSSATRNKRPVRLVYFYPPVRHPADIRDTMTSLSFSSVLSLLSSLFVFHHRPIRYHRNDNVIVASSRPLSLCRSSIRNQHRLRHPSTTLQTRVNSKKSRKETKQSESFLTRNDVSGPKCCTPCHTVSCTRRISQRPLGS